MTSYKRAKELFDRGQLYSLNFFGQVFSSKEELKAAVIKMVKEDMPGTSKGGYYTTASKNANEFVPLFNENLDDIDIFVDGVWDGLHTTV